MASPDHHSGVDDFTLHDGFFRLLQLSSTNDVVQR